MFITVVLERFGDLSHVMHVASFHPDVCRSLWGVVSIDATCAVAYQRVSRRGTTPRVRHLVLRNPQAAIVHTEQGTIRLCRRFEDLVPAHVVRDHSEEHVGEQREEKRVSEDSAAADTQRAPLRLREESELQDRDTKPDQVAASTHVRTATETVENVEGFVDLRDSNVEGSPQQSRSNTKFGFVLALKEEQSFFNEHGPSTCAREAEDNVHETGVDVNV